MRSLDLTLPTLEENLALDEAFLLNAEAGNGSEVLRFWEWPEMAVVLGAGGRITSEADEVACRADGVPLARRSSGGGTVVLGRGCLLYSLVLACDRQSGMSAISSSYRLILGTVARSLGPEVRCAGTSDLCLAGRKFSGNSQKRKRSYFLHHGTILYDFAIDEVARYLPSPPREPEYRAGRTHADFLTNLPLPAAIVKERIQMAWHAHDGEHAWPQETVETLMREKYRQQQWLRRR
jgi:lipoate-protein ligase A